MIINNRSAKEKTIIYRLTIIVWIIFLFDPARLITYHVAALRPLLWSRELLLYGALLLFLFSPKPKKNMKWLMAFMILLLFGTVVAFFTGNWGVARKIVRQMIQYYALGILTINVLNTPNGASTILRLYLYSFLYYALWGLIGVWTDPLTGSADASARQLVYWNIYFDNRDGFGSLTAMGFAFSYYLFGAMSDKRTKLITGTTVISCASGIIISFGRGILPILTK